ncbi:NAD-dependent epimerase/dehydratase family protein [Mariniblastus fucicola]|uniref:dTDP-4-oxo-6-deoxy-D-allose reductase n=1 Tax=Mariniblastus fucicola TaxID=980251 RepID=A0A5B9PJJ8_9BACT|nr:NAD-dependent epimerase/dehydratase family protein [Mariniblastus fucicola]QEG24856.1 dTDP-4-oxo-6-deoxy-D-allose reductase [Mariniblastus fucicola]
MKIFLTGATGFLGNNLLRQLLSRGHQCEVAVRRSSLRAPLSGLNVATSEVDLTSLGDVDRSVRNADVVIHAAALIHIGWSKLDESMRFNVESTRALAESTKRRGKRMIQVSTVDALAAAHTTKLPSENDRFPAKPDCAYVRSKRRADEIFRNQLKEGLDGIIVHPGFMIGPWDWKPSSGKMLLSVAKHFCPFAPGGGCSVVDVRDVSRGIISAMENASTGETYVLGGENLTYLSLWSRIADAVGKQPPRSSLNHQAAKIIAVAADAYGRITGVEPTVNSASIEMGQLLHWYSSQKAVDDLSYRINSVDNAINDAFRWFRNHGYLEIQGKRSSKVDVLSTS